jgi:hypothetical protein
MLDALIAGPDMAERYILAQEVGKFWTDELWADGGLVLDLAERRLLFFGEELMTTMNERRAMFEVLAITWPGYSISWTYDATAEIAAYVDASFPMRDKPSRPELKLADDTAHMHHLVTVVGDDGALRAWPLWWGSSAAWHGPQLLSMLPGPGQHALELGMLPESGIHVDVADKTLGLWLTNPVPGLFRWLAQLWPGWRIEQWDDRYEEHLLRCGPSITAPELDITSGVIEAESWLRQRVFQSLADSPAGRVRSLAAQFGALEPGPAVNSATVAQTAERPTAPEWARFERACAQVRAGRRRRAA